MVSELSGCAGVVRAKVFRLIQQVLNIVAVNDSALEGYSNNHRHSECHSLMGHKYLE